MASSTNEVITLSDSEDDVCEIKTRTSNTTESEGKFSVKLSKC